MGDAVVRIEGGGLGRRSLGGWLLEWGSRHGHQRRDGRKDDGDWEKLSPELDTP